MKTQEEKRAEITKLLCKQLELLAEKSKKSTNNIELCSLNAEMVKLGELILTSN